MAEKLRGLFEKFEGLAKMCHCYVSPSA